MLRGLLEILALLLITLAWLSGQLDPLQKRLQEILLDTMGETKISYGLKSEVPTYLLGLLGRYLTLCRESHRKKTG